MTALPLNAEIYRNPWCYSEDKSQLNKVSKYLQRLVKQMTTDPAEITKDEYFAKIDRS